MARLMRWMNVVAERYSGVIGLKFSLGVIEKTNHKLSAELSMWVVLPVGSHGYLGLDVYIRNALAIARLRSRCQRGFQFFKWIFWVL